MTLSISEQPSQWHRITARHSLLSDATIDPFPHRGSRTASLLDHHIVRDHHKDARIVDNGTRSTVTYLPPIAPPVAPPPPPPQPDARIPHPLVHPDHFHDPVGRKRSHQTMASQDHSEGSSSPTSIGHIDGSGTFCLCQPEPKIPRPRNAFILYRQHQQAAVVRANPGLPNPAISKIIGEQWSHLAEAAKNEWKALAEEEKARHAQQYPDYRYQPRRNGRYSSQSSGSGPPSGGKVDEQGNCVKCGGKTMNPPTTPYGSNHYPTTPRGSAAAMPRPGPQAMVSPPQSGRPTYPERHWPPPPPRYHDPRARYPSVAEEGPDMKRRRFDGNGIYIPTREWREPPYQYSPRGTYFRGEAPPNHRPSITAPPAHTMYAPAQPPPPPKLQLVRPPPPVQHKRDPSLTLAPISTPSTSQSSGLEAMIMSIPIINKVKILSQISPHLPSPSLTSPTPEVRGSVVAIEGMDPATVFSMTNSLAEELEKDGKFAVRIFGGPDPYSSWSSHNGQPLTIAETLNVIGEWHKISEEMKRFITTRFSPVPSPDSAVSLSSARNSNDMTAQAHSSVEHKAEQQIQQSSPTSQVSPRTVNETPQHDLDRRMSYVSVGKSIDGDERPYTRIPAAALAQQGATQVHYSPPHRSSAAQPISPRRATRSGNTSPIKLDTMPPPINASSPTSHQQPPANSVHPNAAPAVPSHPPPAPLSASPIPIALVPHYQLTTVDTAAITLPINDSYSPLAHWQWLATLWRGCIGPDVSVVIKGGSTGSVSGSLGSIPGVTVAINAGAGDEKHDAADISKPNSIGKDSTDASTAKGPGNGSRPSISVQPPQPPNSGGSGPSSAPSGSMSATREGDGVGQGVDVRLLECRTVVVRMGSVGGASTGKTGGEQAEFWEKAKRRTCFEIGEFLRK